MVDAGGSSGRLAAQSAGVVTITGRGRLPTDVMSQVMDVLADEPRVLTCDLTGMAAAGDTVTDMFDAALPYLAEWPATVVVVVAPDAAVRGRLGERAADADRLVLLDRDDLGLAETQGLLPSLQRARLQLSPRPTAPHDAREFVARTLRDWDLADLAPSACLVVSELVTNSLNHAVTVMDLRLSTAEDRVRIAVRDRGGGRPSAPADEHPEHTLHGRGLQLVEAFAHAWGVIPAQARGKTVWAVLDPGG